MMDRENLESVLNLLSGDLSYDRVAEAKQIIKKSLNAECNTKINKQIEWYKIDFVFEGISCTEYVWPSEDHEIIFTNRLSLTKETIETEAKEVAVPIVEYNCPITDVMRKAVLQHRKIYKLPEHDTNFHIHLIVNAVNTKRVGIFTAPKKYYPIDDDDYESGFFQVLDKHWTAA